MRILAVQSRRKPHFNIKGGFQLKIIKILVASTVFTMILGFFVVAPVHAQVDFDAWVGQWLAGAVIDSGVIVDDLGTSRNVQRDRTYSYVQCWDEGEGIYTSWLIQFDDESGTWRDAVPYTVYVVNGTPLDYVGYGFIPPGEIPEIELFALIMHARGWERAGVLTYTMVNSLGGCTIYNLGDGMYFPANESLRLRGVPTNRVPDEVLDKIAGIIPPCP